MNGRPFLTVLALVLALTAGFVLVLYVADAPDWGGWFMIYASFVATGMDHRLRRNRWNLAAVWMGLGFHHAASLVNAYVFVLPGAENDAAAFHAYAVHGLHSETGLALSIGADFYQAFLGFFYSLGGESLLFGQGLSVFAFALSCMVLVRILELLEAGRFEPWLLLLFGVLPSAVVMGSVTLREPFQLVLFMFGVYAGMRIFLRPVWWGVPLSLGALLAMGFFHQLLLMYAVVAAALLCAVAFTAAGVKALHKTLVLVGIITVLIVGSVVVRTVETPPGDDYLRMSKSGVVEALMDYRRGINRQNPRTAFDVELDDSSFGELVSSAAWIYVYYLAAPFPWQTDGVLDVYAAMESMLRIVLLAAMIAALSRSRGIYRQMHILLLMFYVSMTLLWAMGTTNYGQAIRHHMLTNWILIAGGGPFLLHLLWGFLRHPLAAFRSRSGI